VAAPAYAGARLTRRGSDRDDVQGRIRYNESAAQRLTGSSVDASVERKLEDVVGFVDENDRRLLSDPLRPGARERRAGSI